MKRLLRILILALIIFIVLCIANIITNKNGYRLNFEFWSPIESSIMLFSICGLLAYIIILIYFDNKLYRVLSTLLAVISLVILGFFALMGSENVRTLESNDYTIYVKEHRFLFGGHDSLYNKENFFYSKKIGGFTDSDNNSVSYEIKDNQLIGTEVWPKYLEEDYVKVVYIDLD